MANANHDDKYQQSNWPFSKASHNERPRGHEFLPRGGGGNHTMDSPRYETQSDRYRQDDRDSYGGYRQFSDLQGNDGYHQSWQGYGPLDYLHYGTGRQYGYNESPQIQSGSSPDGSWSEGGTRQGQRHSDPDYHQWRNEQISNLDRDYHEYRQERYRKFAGDFDTWRSSRTDREQNTSAVSSNSDSKSGDKSTSSQSGTALPNKN